MAERPRGWASFTKQHTQTTDALPKDDPYPSLVPQGTTNKNKREVDSSRKHSYASVASKSLRRTLHNPSHSEKDSCSNEQNEGFAICENDTNAVALKNSESEDSKDSSSSDELPENDDIYLELRRDALRTARAMGRHAKSAAYAYNVGDHHKAKILSKQVEQEREVVEKLNLQAASEIVKRNAQGRDPWTLDLHGLHAREAVMVLEQKLAELEVPPAPLDSAPRYSENNFSASSSRGDGLIDMAEVASPAPRGALRSWLEQRELKVITGLGVHSPNGIASLPNAVRTFLIENNYQFSEDARPGTIVVKLKRRLR